MIAVIGRVPPCFELNVGTMARRMWWEQKLFVDIPKKVADKGYEMKLTSVYPREICSPRIRMKDRNAFSVDVVERTEDAI